jgi:hypothetical protein
MDCRLHGIKWNGLIASGYSGFKCCDKGLTKPKTSAKYQKLKNKDRNIVDIMLFSKDLFIILHIFLVSHFVKPWWVPPESGPVVVHFELWQTHGNLSHNLWKECCNWQTQIYGNSYTSKLSCRKIFEVLKPYCSFTGLTLMNRHIAWS